MIDQTISHFHVLEKIGGGGMGVVYLAEDTRLKRKVALKFLPPHLSTDAEARQRFEQEAEAASALNHPNVCTIYEIGNTEDGQLFIAMALYEGETLKKKLDSGPLSETLAADIGLQLVDGLSAAHELGITHRDVKPANIFITERGRAVILDFGLAKLSGSLDLTKSGSTLGTAYYMSPEQVRGEHVDKKTDIWSLGVVLYEMLTGLRPFRAEYEAALTYQVLNEAPTPVGQACTGCSDEISALVDSLLAKKTDDREDSAPAIRTILRRSRDRSSAASADLGRATPHSRSLALIGRKQLIAILTLAVVTIAALSWLGYSTVRARSAKLEALPEATRLADQDDYGAAFEILREVRQFLRGDEAFEELWDRVSLDVAVATSPADAEVMTKPYGAADEEWRSLGLSPIQSARIADVTTQWRVSKSGYATVNAIASGDTVDFELRPVGVVPAGMTRVWGGGGYGTGFWFGDRPNIAEFWLDEREVTNKEFKQFVESDGYRDSSLWMYRFAMDGDVLSRRDAIDDFVDATGRPGPSTWELGDYPFGLDYHPVGGVSWFEAAAFCERLGKRLPSIYHWYGAAGTWLGSEIPQVSNFSGEGPLSTDGERGMTPSGAFDMAGNVREWAWNTTEEEETERYVLGGAWNDPEYMFVNAAAFSPFDRSPQNGFRCMLDAEEPSDPKSYDPPTRFAREIQTPVSDEVFEAFRSVYSYSRMDLEPEVEAAEENSDWTARRVSFTAAYGKERIVAHLFLPKHSSPPYQTVVYFPGGSAFRSRSSDDLAGQVGVIDFLIRSGRAVIFPEYSGSYSRGSGPEISIGAITSSEWRDHMIRWSQDLGRSVDYLATLPEIEISNLAYLGISRGAAVGSVILAVEPRIKTAVLLSGGIYSVPSKPEADQVNFSPRITIPVLMMGGRMDFIFPFEETQVSLFDLLGTAESDKRFVVFDTGHSWPRNEMIRETLDWLDRYLGPVD